MEGSNPKTVRRLSLCPPLPIRGQLGGPFGSPGLNEFPTCLGVRQQALARGGTQVEVFWRMSISRKATILAFALTLGSTSVLAPASAQILSGRINQTPTTGKGFTACLSMEGDQCRLIAPTVAIAINVQDGDAIISYLDPAVGGYSVQRKDSVARDLEALMAKGTYGNNQAAYIFAEMLSMHDLMYRLPADQTELRRAMGFPAQAVMTPEDQIGVLTSHLQITLNVSAITADYLINKLGLRVVEATPPQAPYTAPLAEPAAEPTPAPEPAPVLEPVYRSEPAFIPQPEQIPVSEPAPEPRLEQTDLFVLNSRVSDF